MPFYSSMSPERSPPASHLVATPSTFGLSFLLPPMKHFFGRFSCTSSFASHGSSHYCSSSSFLLHHILHFSYPALRSISAIPLVHCFWERSSSYLSPELHGPPHPASHLCFVCTTVSSFLQHINIAVSTVYQNYSPTFTLSSAHFGQPEPQLVTLCLQFPL